MCAVLALRICGSWSIGLDCEALPGPETPSVAGAFFSQALLSRCQDGCHLLHAFIPFSQAPLGKTVRLTVSEKSQYEVSLVLMGHMLSLHTPRG